MSKHPVRAATNPDPYGWRAGTVRVVANALLVLLAFEVGSMVVAVAQAIDRGPTVPVTPVELVLLMVGFLLVRWVYVLPGLLPVLVGIEYVARRAPHARVLTAVLFAIVARLPARFQGRPTEDRGAAQPPAGTAVAPR